MPDRIPGVRSVLRVAKDLHRDDLALPAHAPARCLYSYGLLAYLHNVLPGIGRWYQFSAAMCPGHLKTEGGSKGQDFDAGLRNTWGLIWQLRSLLDLLDVLDCRRGRY